MHTVAVVGGGLILLSIFVLAGKLMAGTDAAMARGAMAFLPVWLIAAALNMWSGVTKAGYTVKEELPFFFLVFGVPAAAALIVVWRLGTAR